MVIAMDPVSITTAVISTATRTMAAVSITFIQFIYSCSYTVHGENKHGVYFSD